MTATLRSTALWRLARLQESYNLPDLFTVSFLSYNDGTDGVELRLNDEDRDGVTHWQVKLGLKPPVDMPVKNFVSVGAAWASDDGVWCGFNYVRVWAVCDIKPEEEATA